MPYLKKPLAWDPDNVYTSQPGNIQFRDDNTVAVFTSPTPHRSVFGYVGFDRGVVQWKVTIPLAGPTRRNPAQCKHNMTQRTAPIKSHRNITHRTQHLATHRNAR